MIVKVDFREKEEFKNMLKTGVHGADVVVEDLQVGDILLEKGADRILIERKTASDYIASIADGRLYRGVKVMTENRANFTACIIVVEKAQEISKEMAFRRMPYHRVMTTEFWIAKRGIGVVKVFRATDLVYLINREIIKAEKGEDTFGSLSLEVKMVNPYRGGNLRAEAVSMVCAPKAMGPTTAVKIMRGKRVIDVLNEVLTVDLKGLTKPQRERLREVLNYIEPQEESNAGEGQ